MHVLFRGAPPRSPLLQLCATGSLLACVGAASAQALAPAQIDPAALQRQEQERQRQLAQPAQPAASPAPVVQAEPAPAAAPAASAGTRFMLRQVVFSPSAFLDSQTLDGIAARYTGREADFATLSQLLDEVNAAYRQQGVLTGRAVLPPQKVRAGSVRIDLVEARLGEARVLGTTYSRPGYLAGLVAGDAGQTIDTRELAERIRRFNRAGSVQLDANLRPGASFGLTDLLLNAREPSRYQARVFANNEGSRNIGREQLGVDAALNGPAGIGDRLALYLTRSRGATLGSLSYALPVNRWGGHVSTSYNLGATDVVAGPYRALDISGRSRAFQLAAVQPVWERGAWYLDLAATVGRTRSDNQVAGAPLSDTTIVNQTFGATFAGATEQRSLSLMATASHARASSVGAKKRDIGLRQIAASWVENAGTGQFALARLSAQDTDDAVIAPSLLFQVGGVASVRGYDVGVLSGDRGFTLNLEFHRSLIEGLTVYTFYDVGQVRTEGLPNQTARAAGLGLDGQWGRSLQYNVSAGRALTTLVPDQHRWRVTARVSWSL